MKKKKAYHWDWNCRCHQSDDVTCQGRRKMFAPSDRSRWCLVVKEDADVIWFLAKWVQLRINQLKRVEVKRKNRITAFHPSPRSYHVGSTGDQHMYCLSFSPAWVAFLNSQHLGQWFHLHPNLTAYFHQIWVTVTMPVHAQQMNWNGMFFMTTTKWNKRTWCSQKTWQCWGRGGVLGVSKHRSWQLMGREGGG